MQHASNFLNTAHSPLKGISFWWCSLFCDIEYQTVWLINRTCRFHDSEFRFYDSEFNLQCFFYVQVWIWNKLQTLWLAGGKNSCCDWLKRKMMIINVLTTKLCLNFRSTFPRSGASRSGRNRSMRRCARTVVWSQTELPYSTNPIRGPSRPGWTDRGSNLFIVIWTIERIKQHLGLLLLVLWFFKCNEIISAKQKYFG